MESAAKIKEILQAAELEKLPDFIAAYQEDPRNVVQKLVASAQKKMDALEKEKQRIENLKIAAVVHGGTIMAVCSSFTDGEYFDFQIGNGEGYRCKVTVGQSSWEIYMDKLCKLVM